VAERGRGQPTATLPAPRPFLKWAGGKQALALRLVAAFPPAFERYFEPFLGGGSVLLALRPGRAVVADRNEWLIDAWEQIRDDPGALLAELLPLPNTREDFVRLRAIDPRALAPARRAALFVYLNKTAFRGLFRVNRAGRFNTPWGAYARRFADPDNLRALSAALRAVAFRRGDFEAGLAGIEPGDFAYLDPPYWPQGGYADFARYTRDPFRAQDHERLAACVQRLDAAGVRFALTNSDTDAVRALYRGFRLTRIAARREINLSAARRGITELLVRNY
jgi:DNA adenine methylase